MFGFGLGWGNTQVDSCYDPRVNEPKNTQCAFCEVVMSSPKFDVVFRGDIVLGHQLAEVKLRLQHLFKADAAKVEALFSGRPVPLKRGLDEISAHKYRTALLQAGAQVDIVASGTPFQPEATASPQFAPLTSGVSAANWTLAATGSDLLNAAERPKVTPLQVDISAISLRPAEGNLLDASEQPAAVAAKVSVPDFAVAELSADLISAAEKHALPLAEITLEDWEIAAAGSDLLQPEERVPAPVVPVVVSDFGLAPVGSDLQQLKPQVKAVVPDTSQLRLVDDAAAPKAS